jgi:hypothetical protein
MILAPEQAQRSDISYQYSKETMEGSHRVKLELHFLRCKTMVPTTVYKQNEYFYMQIAAKIWPKQIVSCSNCPYMQLHNLPI